MIKQVPSPAKIAAMVLFALSCFTLTLFLWVSFGGPVPLQPQGYRFNIRFNEAVQLATEADVRIAGVSVGKVKSVEPSLGRTDAAIELNEKYAPLPSDSRATLRLKTLLGETYVELTPGTKGKGVPAVPEDGRLTDSNVEELVELDEVIRIFDPRTREALTTWLKEQAIALNGRGDDLNEALGTLPIFFAESNDVLSIFRRQQAETRELIRKSADVFEAIDSRPGQLTELVVSADRLLTVTARRNEQIAQTFREFPGFLREAKKQVKRFTAFTENTSEFIDRNTEIAEEFSPLVKQSVDTTNNARYLIDNLDPLLTKADRTLPYVNEFLDMSKPVFSQLDPFLRNLNPVFEFIGMYDRELVSALANDTSATQGIAGPTTIVKKTNESGLHVLKGVINAGPAMLGYSAQRYDKSRGNAYPQPGAYDLLASGLRVFDAAHCSGIPVPTLDTNDADYVAAGFPSGFATLVNKYVYADSAPAAIPSPACLDQGPISFGGETTQYPHVRERTSP